jgi:hypothetical protein
MQYDEIVGKLNWIEMHNIYPNENNRKTLRLT